MFGKIVGALILIILVIYHIIFWYTGWVAVDLDYLAGLMCGIGVLVIVAIDLWRRQ